MSKSVTLKILLSIVVMVTFSLGSFAAKPKGKIGPKDYVVGFYNLENLFDTKDDPKKNDNEFLPEGRNNWTLEKYHKKLHNMARVIAEMKSENGFYHAVLGVAEVENLTVLQDLINDPQISDAGFRIVHYESPDARGIDVALLYRPNVFRFLDSEDISFDFEGTKVEIEMDTDRQKNFRTRNILMVHGTIKGEHFAFYVAHLPSRGGNKGADLRCRGSEIIYNHSRGMEKKYPGIKIVVMGDMNDNPEDDSQKIWLHAKESLKATGPDDFFNPFESIHATGRGSEEYRGDWNIFDIIEVNHNLAKAPKGGLRIKPVPGGKYYGEIFNRYFLTQQDGRYKGTPFRTFGNGAFMNGFSDHYPTFIVIGK